MKAVQGEKIQTMSNIRRCVQGTQKDISDIHFYSSNIQ